MPLIFAVDQSAGLTFMGFLKGSPLYNASVFVLALLAILLAVAALWIAILQLRKIHRAAQAAAEASKEARDQVFGTAAVADVSQLCALSRELLNHIRSGNYDNAVLRTSDLRGALARVRQSLRGRGVPSPKEWQELLTKVVSVQSVLEKGNTDDGDSRLVLRKCARLIDDVHERLNGFASKIEAKAGDR